MATFSWLTNIPIIVSVAAFAVSIFTLWQTQLRRGVLKMTRPTLLFFKREGSRNLPKLFLRTLLFSTGKRGWLVESLFVRVHQKGGTYLFDTWGYGPRELLSPGSGLFVGDEGVVFNHHFLPRESEQDFLFLDGEYRIEIYASLFGKASPYKIGEYSFSLRTDEAAQLIQITNAEVFFEWNVDSQKYIARIERPGMIG